jgi:hypothetical protein
LSNIIDDNEAKKKEKIQNIMKVRDKRTTMNIIVWPGNQLENKQTYVSYPSATILLVSLSYENDARDVE